MNLTITQKLILRSLRKGKQAAISRWKLAERYGMTERAVRLDMRTLGQYFPVCGGYGAAGYYIAGNKEEMREYINALTQHRDGITERIKYVRRFL